MRKYRVVYELNSTLERRVSSHNLHEWWSCTRWDIFSPPLSFHSWTFYFNCPQWCRAITNKKNNASCTISLYVCWIETKLHSKCFVNFYLHNLKEKLKYDFSPWGIGTSISKRRIIRRYTLQSIWETARYKISFPRTLETLERHVGQTPCRRNSKHAKSCKIGLWWWSIIMLCSPLDNYMNRDWIKKNGQILSWNVEGVYKIVWRLWVFVFVFSTTFISTSQTVKEITGWPKEKADQSRGMHVKIVKKLRR